MAGYDAKEPYFLPRGMVDTPMPIHDCEEILLPKLNEWRAQLNHDSGDKTAAAQNFLNKFIPFIIEVVLQDGIYWVQKFPKHPARYGINLIIIGCPIVCLLSFCIFVVSLNSQLKSYASEQNTRL